MALGKVPGANNRVLAYKFKHEFMDMMLTLNERIWDLLKVFENICEDKKL